jgi:hypothetical protein
MLSLSQQPVNVSTRTSEAVKKWGISKSTDLPKQKKLVKTLTKLSSK